MVMESGSRIRTELVAERIGNGMGTGRAGCQVNRTHIRSQ